MRKLFLILLLSLFFTIFLCSCSQTALEQSGSTSGSSLSSSSLPKLPHSGVFESSSDISMGIPDPPIPINKRIYRDFNGKYGLLDKDANILVEAIYDKAEMFDYFFIFSLNGDDGKSWATVVNYSGEQIGPEIGPGYESTELVEKNETGTYFIAAVTDGIRNELFWKDDGTPYLEKIPDIKYWLLDELGAQIIDFTFDHYAFLPAGSKFNESDSYCLWITSEGDLLRYSWNGKEYKLESAASKGENGEEFWEFKKTQYWWNTTSIGYGLINKKGKTIFEPIYSRIDVPFEDRIIVYHGTPYDHVEGESRCYLTDQNGTELACFSTLNYLLFDSGTYIGIAYNNYESANIRPHDEGGDPLPSGFWFTDKNGNLLSERFLSLTFKSYGGEDYRSQPSKPTDIATAVTESGETITFSIEKYLCES